MFFQKDLEDCGENIIFAVERTTIGRIGLDRDTHQIISKTGNTSLVNGGPHPKGQLLVSRWITKAESSQII